MNTCFCSLFLYVCFATSFSFVVFFETRRLCKLSFLLEILGNGGNADDLDPAFERVLTFGAEEVNVVLELKLEYIVFVNSVLFRWRRDGVTYSRGKSARGQMRSKW